MNNSSINSSLTASPTTFSGLPLGIMPWPVTFSRPFYNLFEAKNRVERKLYDTKFSQKPLMSPKVCNLSTLWIIPKTSARVETEV
ncbi:hypothetical protein HBI56_139570 [Parastagonospora nodorum]|uniref:Uncharacterized protein n=1 Tax=Phaeosphaeria nodorum (strain SN15 / ATCC MYA-4574 / FGSC 10173) TaxID=321614 RepID=A0A7U2I9F5_PHANO|nr:hypothetical protein HBH56_128230 [Parastagonospora nodorum]QRD05682.1 hypothetical protein JI435_422620 [Parastagonospora nodorum SN15]KAH3931409.1 hypothetical protein HBH54_095250 [Parastagonospora nodorum]KAH3947220.1 hypothetical protein HBH53_118530 [Parastagonospora nodorum]KAH3970809.1 hypothetical protein HBH51_114940 [Parastagonospora nodorum]